MPCGTRGKGKWPPSPRDGHFFDPLTRKICRATQHAVPEKRMEVMGHSGSFDRPLAATEGPGDPHTFWYVDIHTGKAAVLGQACPMDATDDSQGVVDPARVCIMGASYGGYAALAGVTIQQGIYRCAASYAGVGDINAWVDNHDVASDGDPLVMRRLRQEVGDGQDMKAVSPIRFASKVTVPVLLIHGKDDTVVDFSQSSRMASALHDAGKTVQMVALPGEDHWLSNSETRLSMLQAALDFVMKYNPPDGVK